MTSSIISIETKQHQYDIIIDSDILSHLEKDLAPWLDITKKVIVLSDKNVAPLYKKTIEKSLDKKNVLFVTLPAGEKAKSFTTLKKVLEKIISWRIDRKTLLITLGGGVVGDLGGFVASITLRGIPFVQIPTTLLAQVDSSVGGKTAINSNFGKNLIGTFYQPVRVIIDINFLKTLPLRERRAGYAEILKYGLINDSTFFEWCQKYAQKILDGDNESLQKAITYSCRAKALIVSKDERETGIRALLNFGHTFGHALEAAAGYDSKILLHGEAVAYGIRLAARLSVRLGMLVADQATAIEEHLNGLEYPKTLKELLPDLTLNKNELLMAMESDKKTIGGKKTFILLNAIGDAVERRDVDDSDILAVLS